MPPRHRLMVCPECACHAKLTDTHCPSCGTALFDAYFGRFEIVEEPWPTEQ